VARKRQHTREFKLAALARMDIAPDVKALAQELGVERGLLYWWQKAYMAGGAAGLCSMGRPRPVQLVAPDEALLGCRLPEPLTGGEAAARFRRYAADLS
jgi:transposase-like protein